MSTNNELLTSTDGGDFGPNRRWFAEHLVAVRRRSVRRLCAAAIGFWIGTMLVVAGVPTGPAAARPQLGWLNVTGFVIAVVALTWIFAGLWALDRRLRWRCPRCAAEVSGARSGMLVVTIGRCPRCEAAIWDEMQNALPSAAARPAWASFQTRLATARYRWRPFIVALLFAAAVSGALQLAEPALVPIWERTFGSGTLPFLKLVYTVPLVVLPGAGILWVNRRFDRELPRCPRSSCGHPLSDRYFLHATGRCTLCGESCVADPLPRLLTPVSGQAFDRTEFIARVASWRRVAGLSCLIGAAAAMAWCGLCAVITHNPLGDGELALWSLALPVQLVATLLADRYLARRLECPECRQPLATNHLLVTATGNCPHCAQGILNESGG